MQFFILSGNSNGVHYIQVHRRDAGHILSALHSLPGSSREDQDQRNYLYQPNISVYPRNTLPGPASPSRVQDPGRANVPKPRPSHEATHMSMSISFTIPVCAAPCLSVPRFASLSLSILTCSYPSAPNGAISPICHSHVHARVRSGRSQRTSPHITSPRPASQKWHRIRLLTRFLSYITLPRSRSRLPSTG